MAVIPAFIAYVTDAQAPRAATPAPKPHFLDPRKSRHSSPHPHTSSVSRYKLSRGALFSNRPAIDASFQAFSDVEELLSERVQLPVRDTVPL